MSIPLLRQLRRIAPDDNLILVCRPGLATFFLQTKLVDQVIEIDKKKSSSLREMHRRLKNESIRYWICPHESFRTALITRKIKAQKKIGFINWWNQSFFDIRIARPMQLPEVFRILNLLAPLDKNLADRLNKKLEDKQYHNEVTRHRIQSWPYSIAHDFSLHVEPPVELTRTAILKWRLMRPYVIVAPSSQWATKRWTNEGYIHLIQLLAERGFNVYLVGTAGESDHCHQLEKASAAHAQRVEVRSLAGQTDLLGLHTLMSMAEIVVSNDSGPMHMAAVAGRPVVAIFGPTTLSLGYRPWSDLSSVVQIDLSCRPCGKHGHSQCPINTHDCMKKVTAAQVIQAADHLLKRKAHPIL